MNTETSSPLVVTTRGFWGALLLTLSLSAMLTAGFIPTSSEIWDFLSQRLGVTSFTALKIGHECLFPLLAFLFYRSLGRHVTEPALTAPKWNLIAISILPMILAFGFGLMQGSHNFFSRVFQHTSMEGWLWYLVCAPVGEEFLFRGWVYAVVQRTHGKTWLTATNPLPLALWMSAVAFALWHFQNWAYLGASATLLQVGYTFFTGLWLGVLRWKTKSLWAPMAAHLMINALTG